MNKQNQPHANARQRLADVLDDRRRELGLTWGEVADAASLTTETLRAVRRGTHVIRKHTKQGIDHAMRWQPSRGVDAILTGNDPTPIDPSRSEPPAADEPGDPEAALLLVRWQRDGFPGFADAYDQLARHTDLQQLAEIADQFIQLSRQHIDTGPQMGDNA